MVPVRRKRASQGSSQYYYVKNLQGDIVAIVDKNMTTIATYTYDAWGKITSSSGNLANTNPFRYRGYYYDTETGLYYLNSRYYDPVTGRFLSTDGLVDGGAFDGMNLYAYCGNNPITCCDPSGECFVFSYDLLSTDWQALTEGSGALKPEAPIGPGTLVPFPTPVQPTLPTPSPGPFYYWYNPAPLAPATNKVPTQGPVSPPQPKEKAKPKEKEKPKATYFCVQTNGKGAPIFVYPTMRLNADEAAAVLWAGGSVWTGKKGDAKSLVIYASGDYHDDGSHEDAYHYHLKGHPKGKAKGAGSHSFWGDYNVIIMPG